MARPRLIALALALITLLLYLPVREHEFQVYDDPDYLTQNAVVQAGLTWTGVQWAFQSWHASNWHPLTWLSHMLDCELFGLDAGAHHLVNALFHAANALLTFIVLFRLTGSLWPAAFAAALFAWHPLHIQSVAWAAERKDVLSTLFFWLTLWAYTLHARGSSVVPKPAADSRKWLVISSALFACGLMSKPMLVTLPFILLLLDFWPLGRARSANGKDAWSVWTKLALEKLPFFVLSVASCVVTFLAQRPDAVVGLEPHPLLLRVANALVSYARYLWKTVWPVELAVVYPLPPSWPWWSVASAAALLAVLSLAAYRSHHTKPHLLVGWLWFVGMLVPVIGLVQVGGQAMADRYTYVSLTGLFLALAVEVGRRAEIRSPKSEVPSSRKDSVTRLLVTWLAVLVLGACLVGTHFQLRYWRNSEALFSRALAVTKDNAIAHANLGVAFEQQGRKAEAEREYREALRLNPKLVQPHNNLANLLDESGQLEEALRHYQEAVRLKPRAALARANLGTLLSRLGRHEEALRELGQAAGLSGHDPRPHYLWAKALLRAGRSQEAVDQLRAALRLQPNHLQSLTWLARVLAADPNPAARNSVEAVRAAEHANALTEGADPYVLDTLAIAYADAGRLPEARRALLQAIQLATKAGEHDAAKELQTRLKLFEAGEPYREDFKVRGEPLNR